MKTTENLTKIKREREREYLYASNCLVGLGFQRFWRSKLGLLTFQSFDIKLPLANKSLLNEHQNSLTTSLLGEGVGEVLSRMMFSCTNDNECL